MAKHKNFFETINEAKMRLNNTIVQYRNDFYKINSVGTGVSGDGKFRVYMEQLGFGKEASIRLRKYGFPSSMDYSSPNRWEAYDKFLEKYPDIGFTRKYASSKYFHKFRPFPLGNVNQDGSVIYCERSPTRNMNQGLLAEAILSTIVTPSSGGSTDSSGVSLMEGLGGAYINSMSPEFYAMLKGIYPSFDEVIGNLLDPEISNEGCAFHREFSVMRGPLGLLFLCHRHTGVGLIDSDKNLTLGRPFEYLLEQLEELNVFNSIIVKEVQTYA